MASSAKLNDLHVSLNIWAKMNILVFGKVCRSVEVWEDALCFWMSTDCENRVNPSRVVLVCVFGTLALLAWSAISAHCC